MPPRPSSKPDSVLLVGCGWLGTPLATTLIAQGSRVLATRSTLKKVEELRSLGIETIRLSLGPTLEWERPDLLKEFALAVVLLPPRTRHGSGEQFPETISNLLEGLKSVGIRRVIFTSSTSVYPSENREVDERETGRPDTRSGRILLEAERRIAEDPEIDAVILRLAGLCGPGREPGRLLSGKHDLPGAANPVNLIHQQDAIELLVTLIRSQPWGEIFNGCAPGHPARSILYPGAAEAMGLSPPVFGQTHARYKRVRADKICTRLGFVYRHPDPSEWRW